MTYLDPFACALFVVAAFVIAGIAQTFWLRSELSQRFAMPLDGGRSFRGKRIFGDNKTARGFIVMVPAAALAFAGLYHFLAVLQPRWTEGIWALTGFQFFALGGLASFGFMIGEIPNSFLKRRLGLSPGGTPRGRLARLACFLGDRLDSILGMLLAMSLVVPTPWQLWLFVLLIGPGIHLLFSAALFSLGVKRRWA